MLILTRRPGESIMIENNDAVAEEESNSESESIKLGLGQALITITILRVKGGQVSLGIDAPSSISILREEIYHKSKQGANASKSNYADDYDSEYPEEEDDYS